MPKSKELVILGIDPGLADTGYGLISVSNGQVKYITCGSIKTSSKLEMVKRLGILFAELNKILKKHQPTLVGIEKLFFAANAKTALAVGQARGVALLTLAQNNLPIIELTPLQVKQALTGYGAASKDQVGKMVKLTLKLSSVPKPDDATDALAIALAAADYQRFKKLTEK